MNNKLYRDTLKLIRETNKRLAQLEKGVDLNKGRYNPKTKRFERPDTQVVIRDGKRIKISPSKRVSYKTGTWASKKLLEKVPESIIKGKVSTNISSYSKVQLTALNKALKNFLKSKTSTVKGIQEIEKQTKENIAQEVENFDEDMLSSQDINTLYDFFNDKDFNYATDYIAPSDLWVILTTAKANNDSDESFINRVGQYIDKDSLYEDLDLKDALIRIYHKFQ